VSAYLLFPGASRSTLATIYENCLKNRFPQIASVEKKPRFSARLYPSPVYFLVSLWTCWLRHHLQYFFSSILRVTSFLFLRDQ